jgi:hypothetical protein
MPETSREIRLRARPSGWPVEGDFELAEVELADPGQGEVLIRNAFLSVDPYMRARMTDRRSYVPPFALGEPLSGGAVGQVVASRNDQWPEGSWVFHMRGWREAALSDGCGLLPVDPDLAPVSTALGVLGMPGLTAYVGLHDIGRLQERDVVYVSGAAGAVGSIACQLARLGGAASVVGSAGSAAKVDWLQSLGVEAFDYRETPVREALRERAPDGIDLAFDNVGGTTLEDILASLRDHGRVVACGAVSQLNETDAPAGPRNMSNVVSRRLRLEGFIVSDHYDRLGRFVGEVAPLVRDGSLVYRETVLDGIEQMPAAFIGMLRGDNIGKMLVRVGEAA